MRIRIFRAFASNNSGSYTIVGTFQTAEVAEDVAQVLREACVAHSKWHDQNSYEEDGDAPLDAFAREHELTEAKPGRGDAWPQYGDPPKVLAVAHQVLVHAPYTVTMPRLFGEFFYKRGGRVEIELDHSHEQLAVEFSFYPQGVRWDDPEKKEREEELQKELQEILPDLTKRREHDRRPPIAPAFHLGFWGSRHLSAVFTDLVEGIEAVRVVAARRGIGIHLRLAESPHGATDPLAHLRPSTRPWGTSRVILWAPGADRIAAMKAAREVLGTDLAGAKEALEGLPKEVLVDVDLSYAERAAQVLREAGCDAEAVQPSRDSES